MFFMKNKLFKFKWIYFRFRMMHPIRSHRLRKITLKVLKEHGGILDKIGSDYDENGIPYWEKWHKPLTDQDQ